MFFEIMDHWGQWSKKIDHGVKTLTNWFEQKDWLWGRILTILAILAIISATIVFAWYSL